MICKLIDLQKARGPRRRRFQSKSELVEYLELTADG
jgi:hypothetical protein